jgi:hypothetical protein
MENCEFCKINNKQTIDFYKKNPKIDFDKVNFFLVKILEINNISHDNEEHNLEDNNLMSYYAEVENNNSLNYNITGKKMFESLLNKLKPTSEITKNIDNNLSYNFMMNRINLKKIIIESKENNENIKDYQVDSFIDACTNLNCSGIFVSQKSGIINKDNYQIDIINKNILVYIHYLNYDIEKIKIAIKIIDNIHEKLFLNRISNNQFVSNDELKEIKKEYQCFMKQKCEIKKYIKDVFSNITNQLNHINFEHLDKSISNMFTDTEKIGIYKCDLCNFYTSATLKGIAAHKRGCKKKY